MTAEAAHELGAIFAETAKNYAAGGVSPVNLLSCKADILGNILSAFMDVDIRQYSDIVRIVTFYASTSTDPYKAAILDRLTGDNGLLSAFAYFLRNTDTAAVWVDYLSTISTLLANSAR